MILNSELTLLLLRVGFLVLLWFFVFAVVYAIKSDLFGSRVRKLPVEAAIITATETPVAASKSKNKNSAASTATSTPATLGHVSRIVITSGPKTGLEVPLGKEPLTIGRSSESGLIIRDDYTSNHHARLVLWGDQWMIQDLDSTNGTWHDGVRVASPVAIQMNTPVKVGATTFELRN